MTPVGRVGLTFERPLIFVALACMAPPSLLLLPKLPPQSSPCASRKIRLLLHYCGERFEDRRYQVGPAPTYDKSSWLRDKDRLGLPFPNLPYYISADGTTRLTQSHAILVRRGFCSWKCRV